MSESNHIYPIFDRIIAKEERQAFLNQKAHVFWLTGLSGSGKSTLAIQLERILFNEGYFPQILDGDNIRNGICSNLHFSLDDRKENIRRVAEIAKLYLQSGVVAICSFVSPTLELRSTAKSIIGDDFFKEIYIHSSIEACEERDPKGIYKKVRSGEIKNFTGIDSPYESPENADLVIDTEKLSIAQSTQLLYDFVKPLIDLK